jgi:hypothetical protein
LEVIKENHSEFSNSNSVIDTFRNKRKQNASSSGNNSGDLHNIHTSKIEEEDENDENDAISFRGPRNQKDSIHDIINANPGYINPSEEEDKIPENPTYSNPAPNPTQFNQNENLNEINFNK